MKGTKIRITPSIRTGKKTGRSVNKIGMKKTIPGPRMRNKVK